MDRKQCFKSFWLTSVSCLSLGVVSVVSLRLLAEVYRRRIDDVSRPLLGVLFLLSFLSTGAFGMSLHSIFFWGTRVEGGVWPEPNRFRGVIVMAYCARNPTTEQADDGHGPYLDERVD